MEVGAAFVAAIISWTVSWGIRRWGKRLGIVDDPAIHKHPKVVHERPVPRGGGVPILAALVTIFLWVELEMKLAGIVMGALVLAGVGFMDDKFQEKISPYLRLGLNMVAALVVIWAGVGVSYITNPLGGIMELPEWVGIVFVLVWLVGMQNIVGWSSGVDGQLPGFVIIAAVTIIELGRRFNVNQQQVIILGAVTAGAYLGFLPWNWYPQKIMPGYGGKSLAGFLLGVLAILSGAKVGAMMMVLGLPIIDAMMVIVKRIKEGRSPVWGGREHLHHYLLELGWSKRRIAIFYWLVSAGLAIVALQLNVTFKYFTMAAIGLVTAGGILWLHHFSTLLRQPGPDSG